MKSEELRKKFLDFFAQQNHQIVPSSSLIPSDQSVLFTTAGMQQFKEYFLGKESPYGKRVVSCQKCFRTSDIEKVGNESHLTFLEMLGNFSFGFKNPGVDTNAGPTTNTRSKKNINNTNTPYFKKEAIEWAYKFITKELGLKIDYVSVFSGDAKVPPDYESEKIWLNLGLSPDKIKKMGREDNFWGPTGDEGPCGPTTEIYINNLEVWNLVFNEYYQDKEKKLTLLKEKGVDTGMGFERLMMVIGKKNSVYETELFLPIINKIKKIKNLNKIETPREIKIIADHIRAIVFLIAEEILPSNLERGYVLRRLLRRIIRYGKILNLPPKSLIFLVQEIIKIYKTPYPDLKSKEINILTVIQNEEKKFEKTLEKGLKEFKKEISKMKQQKEKYLSGKRAFYFYETYGFPIEMIKELIQENHLKINEKEFQVAFKKHQELSRLTSTGMFKGGLIDESDQSKKYHTATHLLHQALREILGSHVIQKGSNITPERLRFDFFHPQKMSDQEIKKVEEIVNQKIKQGLPIICQETTLEEAKKIGALGVFEQKYGNKVKVYLIGDFSKEICGGPHVESTTNLGHFKILKEESVAAGTRRIKAILE